jgi:hypothetical protein
MMFICGHHAPYEPETLRTGKRHCCARSPRLAVCSHRHADPPARACRGGLTGCQRCPACARVCCACRKPAASLAATDGQIVQRVHMSRGGLTGCCREASTLRTRCRRCCCAGSSGEPSSATDIQVPRSACMSGGLTGCCQEASSLRTRVCRCRKSGASRSQ